MWICPLIVHYAGGSARKKKVLKTQDSISLHLFFGVNYAEIGVNIYISVKITPKMRVIYAKKSFTRSGLAGRRMAFFVLFFWRGNPHTQVAPSFVKKFWLLGRSNNAESPISEQQCAPLGFIKLVMRNFTQISA